jgi:hypothetical protein
MAMSLSEGMGLVTFRNGSRERPPAWRTQFELVTEFAFRRSHRPFLGNALAPKKYSYHSWEGGKNAPRCDLPHFDPPGAV